MNTCPNLTIATSPRVQINFNRIRYFILILTPIVILSAAALMFSDWLADLSKLGYIGVFAANLIAAAALIV
ncbi:MAG: hypothetical protein QF878_04155, partial [SAR202 cluster bacterium]|nr:hypothetical protein [SAR202 cluster bacterium]